MSKQYSTPEVTAEYATYELKTYDVCELEGQLLTFIDATFSDPQQRKAQKDIIRQMVWNWVLPKALTSTGNFPTGATGINK